MVVRPNGQGPSDLALPARRRSLQQATHFARFPFWSVEGVAGGKYYCIRTKEEFDLFFEEALKKSRLAVDTETSNLNWVKGHVCGYVIGWGPEDNFYIPIRHTTGEKQLSPVYVIPKLKILLEKPTIKYLANAKYDRHMCRKDGIELGGPLIDMVPFSYLVDENGDHGVKELAEKYIHKDAGKWEKAVSKYRVDRAKELRGEFSKIKKQRIADLKKDKELVERLQEKVAKIKAEGKRATVYLELSKIAKEQLANHEWNGIKKKDISYDMIKLEILFPYACADVHYTWILCCKYFAEVAADEDLKELCKTETDLANVLFDTEQRGILVDIPYLQDIGPKMDNEISRFAEKVYAEIGYQFDIDSNDELIKAFNEAGVKLTKLTKKSQELAKRGDPVDELKYSVDAEVLEELATKYKFARSVLDYRGQKKLKSTYVDGILGLVDDNGFVHTNFNQNVRTGRMSSSSPNLQNIPARDKTIRRAFTVPNDDYLFIFIDYSQVELRLTAHYSQDPSLLACYPFQGEGTDVHSLTTAEVVMDIPYSDVLAMSEDDRGHDKKDPVCACNSCMAKFYRTIAKRVNFGIIYGAGPGAIQRQVSTPERPVTQQACKHYIEKYFSKYRGVKRWIDETRRYLRDHKRVQNYFGRYRRFPDFDNVEFWQKDGYARQAVNFLIQGTAADLFKKAITRVARLLKDRKTKIVNFVHDELQFYWHKDELHLLREVKDVMEDFDFSIPIVAEIAYSKTDWASKKELKAA